MQEFLLASSITSYHINHPTHFTFLCLHFHYLLSQPSQWGPVCSSSISCWFLECQDQRHTHVLCSKAQNSWDILPWATGCLHASPTTSNLCPHGASTVETVGLQILGVTLTHKLWSQVEIEKLLPPHTQLHPRSTLLKTDARLQWKSAVMAMWPPGHTVCGF